MFKSIYATKQVNPLKSSVSSLHIVELPVVLYFAIQSNFRQSIQESPLESVPCQRRIDGVSVGAREQIYAYDGTF